MGERRYTLTDREMELFNVLQSHHEEVMSYDQLVSRMGITRENLRGICSRLSAKDPQLVDVDHGVGVRLNNLNGLSVNVSKKQFTRTIPD